MCSDGRFAITDLRRPRRWAARAASAGARRKRRRRRNPNSAQTTRKSGPRKCASSRRATRTP
eukprot:7768608-Pyramimonas_sp.AAC.1